MNKKFVLISAVVLAIGMNNAYAASIAPKITTQPLNATVIAPAPATFKVVATGTPAPSYQWMRSSDGVTFTDISGATKASYTTAATTATENGRQFKCVVSNAAGSVTSSAAIMTVEAMPSITTQPVNATVIAPAKATFKVVATGTPAPSYQWMRSSDGVTFTDISGATKASYTTAATTATENGRQFKCVVSNAAGSVTSSAAIMTVEAMPSITTQPVNATVIAPAKATFKVVASGTPVPSYQWMRSSDGVTFTDISGATKASYTTAATTATENGRQFKCVVSNAAGSVTSSAAIMTVEAMPSITTQPVNATVIAPAKATFKVVASGTPAPTYQWMQETSIATSFEPIIGATSASYTTPATTIFNNETEYECVVTNSAGSVTSNPAILTVQSAPVAGPQGPALVLSRYYRSFSTLNGMFGFGWRTDYDINLTVDSSGNVTIYDGQGAGSYFMNNAGTYIPSPGNYSALTLNSNNTYTLTDKNGNITNYDINGRLSSRIDRNGNALSFVYNPAMVGGSYIQDASGRKIVLYFNSNNNIISAVDPAGKTFQYGYDVNGNLDSIADPTGAVTSYLYNSSHQIIQFTNANGHNTYYQYDTMGRVVMTYQDNNVNKVTLNYQPNNTTVVTDSLGNNTYVFNSIGLLASHTDPLGAVTQETWDINMNRTSITDARNHVTSLIYDLKGNLVAAVDPLNNFFNIFYTPNFNLISSKADALGDVTSFVYDTKGNLTTITDALGNNHSFSYDQYGNAITATDSLGNSTNFTYDAYGRIIKKTDPLGDNIVFTYDADSNILTKTDALSHTTSYQYDNDNRLLKNTFADGSTISQAYDLFGNQISVTDQRGNTLTKTYDPYERLSQTKDPLGGITQFSYDTNGDLLTLTDANNHNTSYTYDADYRVLTQTNALNFTTSFAYDPVGNISTRTDANGKSTNYTYDALNRLTNTAYPDGTSVANVYDALGRKTAMTDSTGQTSYSYDPLSRLLTKTSPGANNTITYTYDSEGNRLSSVDQNNRTITNAYDALNRLSTVTDPNGITSYAYDAVSNEIAEHLPNGVTESYTYDPLNRVLTDVNAASSGVISLFSNMYDIAGMITKKTLQDGSWTAYSYDALNRLLEETKQTSTSIVYDYVYTYDPVGNRLSWVKNTTLGGFWSTDYLNMPPQVLTNMTTAGYGNKANPTQATILARIYNYDAANRLTGWNYGVNIYSASFPVQSDVYTYDNNGNRLTKQATLTGQASTPQETNYTYDFENRLISLDYTNIPNITGTQTDTLAYNGEGLRTQAILNSVPSNYSYDGMNILVERDGSGNTTKSYTRGLDLGGGIGSLIDQNIPGTNPVVQYYDYNDLGSTADLTTTTGTAVQSYTYDAFGNLLAPRATTDTNRYLFSTKEFDYRSGLDYFGRRYYDPEVGRWITPDPLGFINGPNPYLYCLNNPINLIDPYGLMGERLYQGTLGFLQGSELGAGIVGILGLASLSTGIPEVVATGALIADASGTIAGVSGGVQGLMTHNYYQAGTSALLLGVGQVVNIVGPATELYQNVSYNYAAARFTQGGLFINTLNGANNTILKSTISSTVGSTGGIGAAVVGAYTNQSDNSDDNNN